MNNTIVFNIDNTTFIEVILPCQINELEGCEIVTINLHFGNQFYTLYKYNCIEIAIENLRNLLKQAINNELGIHSSILKDLGYLANEYFQESSQELFFRREKVKMWIGMEYLVWSPRGTSTWLFNKNREIFLEITPSYMWHFSDPEEGENFITYEEFLKDYKPHCIFKLSKEIVLEWLNKTEELLNIMKRNYEQCKYLHEAEVSSID
ncbi:hypothetical protein H0X48_05755 [Candidatus Dependentiae bacterium]|nr:hypothetical protein [Tatlockia sp.]MBA3954795.1 hypothetical protein [Candidatus Dependentiae bacterium]